MAVVNKRLAKGTFGSSEATIYTVPASTKAYIKAITFCNISATARNISLKLAGVNVLYNFPLSAQDTITMPFLDHILEGGETITGSADESDGVDYYISGREVS